MIKQILRVLLLEDSKTDAILIERQLRKVAEHLTIETVETQLDYERKIEEYIPNLILSDYKLPTYSGLEALIYAKDNVPSIPFIFVTGTLDDDELAAHTILSGASGLVLKTNLDRLPEEVQRVMDKYTHIKNLNARIEQRVQKNLDLIKQIESLLGEIKSESNYERATAALDKLKQNQQSDPTERPLGR